ncbi:MAG: hypothetical protein ACREV0_11910 [Burkholderiales bacterium]
MANLLPSLKNPALARARDESDLRFAAIFSQTGADALEQLLGAL